MTNTKTQLKIKAQKVNEAFEKLSKPQQRLIKKGYEEDVVAMQKGARGVLTDDLDFDIIDALQDTIRATGKARSPAAKAVAVLREARDVLHANPMRGAKEQRAARALDRLARRLESITPADIEAIEDLRSLAEIVEGEAEREGAGADAISNVLVALGA